MLRSRIIFFSSCRRPRANRGEIGVGLLYLHIIIIIIIVWVRGVCDVVFTRRTSPGLKRIRCRDAWVKADMHIYLCIILVLNNVFWVLRVLRHSAISIHARRLGSFIGIRKRVVVVHLLRRTALVKSALLHAVIVEHRWTINESRADERYAWRQEWISREKFGSPDDKTLYDVRYFVRRSGHPRCYYWFTARFAVALPRRVISSIVEYVWSYIFLGFNARMTSKTNIRFPSAPTLISSVEPR